MKKNLKKTLILVSLIASISGSSAMAMMPRRNNLGQNNIFNNNNVINNQLNEEEKIEKFDNIITEYKDNNYEGNYYYDEEYVFATSEENRSSTFKEFVGQQLLTTKNDGPSLYKKKLELINALEARNFQEILNISKEILEEILGNHIYYQAKNLENNESLDIYEQMTMDEQENESSISNFINTLVNNFKFENIDGNIEIQTDQLDYVSEIDEYRQDPKKITFYRMYSLYTRFMYYMQKIYNEYLNK